MSMWMRYCCKTIHHHIHVNSHQECISCLRRQSTQVLAKVLELRQSHIDVLTRTRQAVDSIADTPEASVLPSDLQLVRNQASVDTSAPDTLRNMSITTAAARWRDYVQQIAILLVDVEVPNPPPDAISRLEDVAHQAGSFVQTMAVVNPQVSKKMVQLNYETMEISASSLNEEVRNAIAFAGTSVMPPRKLPIFVTKSDRSISSMFCVISKTKSLEVCSGRYTLMSPN